MKFEYEQDVVVFVAVPIGLGVAMVVDRQKIILTGGNHSAAVATIPVETTAQTDVALPALLNATTEIEYRYEHPKGESAPTRTFYIGGDVNIEVADKEVVLWVGRQDAYPISTRSRYQVAGTIVGLLQVIDVCEAMDDVRVINQILARRAQAAQALASPEGR